MGKNNKTYKVKSLNNVKTDNYIDGDMFITNRSIGILFNGKIKTIPTNTPNMSNYVKKEDIQKIVYDIMNEVKNNDK